MEVQPLPSPEQLGKELGKFVKNGLGRGLPGTQDETTVQALSDISRELATNPSEGWKRRIARVVIEAVKELTPEVPDRLAVADVLAIGDPARLTDDLIADIEAGEDVASIPDRHAQAANRYPRMEAKTFADDRRRPLFREVGQRLIDMAAERRDGTGQGTEPAGPGPDVAPPAEVAEADEPQPSSEPSTLVISAIGAGLVVVGLAWLIAVVVGAVG